MAVLDLGDRCNMFICMSMDYWWIYK